LTLRSPLILAALLITALAVTLAAVAAPAANASTNHKCHEEFTDDDILVSFSAQTLRGAKLTCREASKVFVAASKHRNMPARLRVAGKTWNRIVQDENDEYSAWVYARAPSFNQQVIITVM
jgi:hypothetical protein